MRWVKGGHAVVLAMVLVLASCGSDEGDRLTMSFVGFTGDGITQADSVGATSADVDICLDICEITDEGDVTLEVFTQTSVAAIFENRGAADIQLDRVTIDVAGSGVAPVTRFISALLTGGRCSSDADRRCAQDSDCGTQASCLHNETRVPILLYDFDFKNRVIRGQCPFPVITQTLQAELTFSGVDDSGERFTITTFYGSTFDNFDNCEA